MSLSVDHDETYTIHDCHARIQEFSSGGGGGSAPGQSDKKALTTFCFSPQLILQSQMVNFKENYHFLRFLRGSNIFRGGGGGGPTFSGEGGSNCLFL